MDKGFEIRTYDAVPKALLRHCGSRNPLSDDSGKFVWRGNSREWHGVSQRQAACARLTESSMSLHLSNVEENLQGEFERT